MLLWICQETFGPYEFLNIQELRGEAVQGSQEIQAFPLLVSHYGVKYPLLSLIGIALCFVSLEF